MPRGFLAPIFFMAVWGLGIGGMLLWERLHRKHEVKVIIERPTMPIATLPPSETVNCRCVPILPAWQFDASDSSDEATMYCPICALEGVTISGLRDADGYYPLPRGKRVLCGEHTVRWEQRIEGDTL